ncbi:hypothetical protein G7K_0449-t1 [Saitoella complicata NRRL Y-17804]|uniref:SnoaL-like domain-containing protein n=1 Tax=Saitoella complicata (strain BCRC 22490 / CBS 7301 / JCM 7358 / NBRC 10748 / NRRL Y-17804) TaxID=698492 RepID=A0A0E9N8R7_SAICN|nr:hypothetical protein G7K_0449-t1 [Saitoella complicata NRRL Y-17804]
MNPIHVKTKRGAPDDDNDTDTLPSLSTSGTPVFSPPAQDGPSAISKRTGTVTPASMPSHKVSVMLPQPRSSPSLMGMNTARKQVPRSVEEEPVYIAPLNVPDRLLTREAIIARNKYTIQRYMDYWNNGSNSDEIYEIIHPDHRQIHHIFTGIGVEHKRNAIVYFRSRFASLHARIEHMTAEGDTIISFIILRGVQQGENFGHPDRERIVNIRMAFRDRFLDGLIRETEIIADYEQLRKVPWTKKLDTALPPSKHVEPAGLSVVPAEFELVIQANLPRNEEGEEDGEDAAAEARRGAGSRWDNNSQSKESTKSSIHSLLMQ